MGLVLSFVTDSPTTERVIDASIRAGRAMATHGATHGPTHCQTGADDEGGSEVRFIHFGGEDAPGAARIRELLRHESRSGAVLDVRPVTSHVDREIRAAISAAKPDLVVIGAVQRESTLRDVFGSTARQVAQRSPCSVLLVSTKGRAPAHWSRLVAGVDFSAPSSQLASWMLNFARAGDTPSSVYLAHEIDAMGAGMTESERAASRAGDAGRLYDAATERFRIAGFLGGLDARDVRVEAITLPGRRGPELARYAEDSRSDLLGIVAPNRPLGALSRLLSHPVLMVLEHLPCSVLVFRASRGSAKSGGGTVS